MQTAICQKLPVGVFLKIERYLIQFQQSWKFPFFVKLKACSPNAISLRLKRKGGHQKLIFKEKRFVFGKNSTTSAISAKNIFVRKSDLKKSTNLKYENSFNVCVWKTSTKSVNERFVWGKSDKSVNERSVCGKI